jgi:regulatory protein
MEAAAAFLGVRPRSVAETRRRLRRLGYPNSLVEVVVQRLVEMEYLDDVEFAQLWIESRDRARPRGQAALRRELALKGVTRDVIDDALAERSTASGGAESVDAEAAARLLERRRSALDREADLHRRRQKAYTLLSRNGFDPQVCAQASAVFVGQAAETD